MAHVALVTAEVLHHRRGQVAIAVRVMVNGREAPRFWAGVVGALVAVALAVVAIAGVSPVTLTALASIAALIAIVLYEAAFVRAGQAVPLS